MGMEGCSSIVAYEASVACLLLLNGLCRTREASSWVGEGGAR